MRRLFIAGNWKMYKTVDEAVALVDQLRAALGAIGDCEIAVCPPFPALAAVRQAVAGSRIMVGAQNMHWEEYGAFTGAVSPLMLQGLCDCVIIGHSERRTLFNETDELVSRKLRSALEHGLLPILCVGENLEQNRAGQTAAFVGGQVRAAFAGISPEQAVRITVAYEPIWAIGTGIPATGEGANEIIGGTVRRTLAEIYDHEVAQTIRVQYGGSVKPGNIAEFAAQPEIDGALVGGASLRADDFAAIIRNALEAQGTS